MEFFKKLKELLPKINNISIFSNIYFFKNIQNSNIDITKFKNKDENLSKTVTSIEIENLDINFFIYNNIKIELSGYHEVRLIKNNHVNDDFDRFNFFSDAGFSSNTLLELIQNENKIILLGNPGIGKTEELYYLFNKLWESKIESKLIPFYINTRNFTPNKNFEELIIFKDWEKVKNICFIIDGLDEISNINNFVSQLETFLIKYESKDIQIVISCRTNIYEKYLINISGFKYYFLENLDDQQIKRILKKNFDIKISFSILQKYRVFLENPFNLNLFANFYKENNRFPETVLEAFDLSIKNELQATKEKVKNRIDIEIPYIKKYLMKIALTNELMQNSFIFEDNLAKIVSEKHKSVFDHIPFIEKLPDSENYIFRHKNYQEFFSAKFLSELEVMEIISIIKISDEINKTKPSLFNTITFLLNIIDIKKFDEIKDWLRNNEPEILFLAEKDRINPDVQKEIFREYFTDIAINKTFWFGRDKRFSIEKVAQYADIDFLISIVQHNDHFRSVKSAIEVLSYTDDYLKDDEIKNLLLKIIISKSENFEDALRAFKNKKFHISDEKAFFQITECFQNDYFSEVHHQIIFMLNDYEKIDDYFGILQNSLNKLYEIRPERVSDRTIRGTTWILEKIILRLSNLDNYLQIFRILFDPKFDLKLDQFYNKDFEKKLFEKTTEIISKNEDFLSRLLRLFLFSDSHIFHREEWVVKLIKESEKKDFIFRYLIEHFGISSLTRGFLSITFTEYNLNFFIENFKNKKIQLKDNYTLENFRNFISHQDFELAKKLEDRFVQEDFIFEDFLITNEQRESYSREIKTLSQSNFDILFDKEKLLFEISKVYLENNIEIIDWHKINELVHNWNSNSKNHYLTNSIYKTISDVVSNNGSQTYKSIEYILEDNYVILSILKNKIKNKRNEEFLISDEQIEFIKKECKIIVENFKYNKVIKFNELKPDQYAVYLNFYVLKTVYFFDIRFNFNYPKDFYLKTLRFCNFNDNDKHEILPFIKEKVNDSTSFNNQIVDNINNKKLDSFSLNHHIDYALENKLFETYKKIEELILKDKYLYNNSYFKQYASLLPPNEKLIFLKKCCNNIQSYLCWSAIDILKKMNTEKEFIFNIAEKYLSNGYENHISKAIDVYFFCNKENSISVYLKHLKIFKNIDGQSRRDDYSIGDISSYKNLNELLLLHQIFDIVYEENDDVFAFHYGRPNMQNLVINLSKSEVGYNEVKKTLLEIKAKIETDESKFFYINNLIEESELSYYNYKSKKYSFKEATILIENIVEF